MFRIDPKSGGSALMGTLGSDLRSSGDLVSVALHGTLATVTGVGTDVLVRIDPDTGKATPIGPIGFVHVWGLGFWQNRVFGFTDQGQFISVDPATGTGTLVRTLPNLHFWGAGVTTSAPVIQCRIIGACIPGTTSTSTMQLVNREFPVVIEVPKGQQEQVRAGQGDRVSCGWTGCCTARSTTRPTTASSRAASATTAIRWTRWCWGRSRSTR